MNIGVRPPSLDRNDFNWLDPDVPQGILYYRLRQTDYEGHFSWSPVIAIRSGDSDFPAGVYPNPIHDTFIISTGDLGEGAEITVFDGRGRQVEMMESEISGYRQISFRHPVAGLYQVKVATASNVSVYRILVDP